MSVIMYESHLFMPIYVSNFEKEGKKDGGTRKQAYEKDDK